jgi:hypothetical protein
MGVQERLEQVARLAGWGTVTAYAEAAGIKPGTAQKHKDRDSIPAKRVGNYIDAAKRRGIDVSAEWLIAGRGSAPKRVAEISVPPTVDKIPTGRESSALNKDSALRLPLWQINVLTRGADAVPVLAESRDKVLAPEALRDFTDAFAVRMWDSSNGPYVPRGMILYVERPYGGALSELCLFAEGHNHKELTRPVVGILDREDETTWFILQHLNRVELPKADFPICWRIKHTRRD